MNVCLIVSKQHGDSTKLSVGFQCSHTCHHSVLVPGLSQLLLEASLVLGNFEAVWPNSWPFCIQLHPRPSPPGWTQPTVLCLYKGRHVVVLTKVLSNAKRRGIFKTSLETWKVGQAASGHWHYWAAEFRTMPRAVTSHQCWGLLLEACLDQSNGCSIQTGTGPFN